MSPCETLCHFRSGTDWTGGQAIFNEMKAYVAGLGGFEYIWYVSLILEKASCKCSDMHS